jgi:hypothetical protein
VSDDPDPYNDSRTGDMLNAEMARAGDAGGRPCAGYILLLTRLVQMGTPWSFIRELVPDLRRAILIAYSRDAQTQSHALTLMLAAETALANDLRDRGVGREG